MQPIPKVGIGIPVYNGERFLADSIHAVEAQTFSDYEVIISDNGSTDATEQICQDYARRDDRVRYVRFTENQGASRNFNRVFELSRARYFKWLADDDLIAPTFIERGVRVLDGEPDVAMVYSNTHCIDSTGRVIGSYDRLLTGVGSGEPPAEQFRRLLAEYEGNGGASANVYAFGLFRSSALRRTSLVGNHILADLNLTAHVALLGRFVCLPEYLQSLRTHPGSSSWFVGAQWDNATMQEFFDPNVRTPVQRALALRRHHLEYPRAVLRSDLPWREKLGLLVLTAQPPLRLFGRKVARVLAPMAG